MALKSLGLLVLGLAVFGDLRVEAQPRASPSSDPLERPAKLSISAVPLPRALEVLAATSGVNLVYSPSRLPAHEVSCDCFDRTVGEVLAALLEDPQLRFSVLGNHVVIERAKNAGSPGGPLAPREADVPRISTATVAGATTPPTPAAPPRTAEVRRTVAGRIIDRLNGQPLAGVQVTVPGTPFSTLTDAAGRYELPGVPSAETTIRATRIGYAPTEVEVDVDSTVAQSVNLEMEQTFIELDGVVASIEARQARRRETGTNLGWIDVDEANATGAFATVSELLHGRASGIYVAPAGGGLGKGSRIRVRGVTSITQPNNPLVIIDGVRADNNTDWGNENPATEMASRYDDLNADEIANIQIVKGPSATALYGSEAAVGVLVITTKRGRAGAPQLSVRSRYGYSEKPTGFPDNYSNVTEFYGVRDLDDPRIAYVEAERHPLTGDIYIKHNPLEDPRTAPYRGGSHLRSIGGEITGGGSSFRYFSSLEYSDETGLLEKEHLGRLNARGNLDLALTRNLEVSANVGFFMLDRKYQPDQNHYYSLGTNAYLGSPTSALDGLGRCIRDVLRGMPDTGTEGWCSKQGNLRSSISDLLEDWRWGEDVFRTTTAFSAAWRPTGWLTHRLSIGQDRVDRTATMTTAYNPRRPFGSFSEGNNEVNEYNTVLRTIDYTSTLSHQLTSRLESATTAGFQYFSRDRRSLGCLGQSYTAPELSSCHGGPARFGSSGSDEKRDLGVFLLQHFGWSDYAFITGAVRRDDNAALGESASAVWSPSANASLVLSDMPFWGVDWVSNLRLRAAWGRASQSPQPYQADQFYRPAPVKIDGQVHAGVVPALPGNPYLSPERSEEVEFGVEAEFFRFLGLSLSRFTIDTRNLIVPAPVAPSSGFSEPAFANLAAMKSTGWEVALDAALAQHRNFAWDVTFTHSTANPVITDLGLPAPILLGGRSGSRSAGSQAFATGYAPGVYVSPVIREATREPDGTISAVEFAAGNLAPGSNLVVVGKPQPDGQQSLSTRLNVFGHWTITALFDRIYGASLYNVTRAFRTPFSTTAGQSSYSREYVYRQVESAPTMQAMFERNLHAAYIEDGDYTKFRELSLRYTLPESVAARVFGASAASVRLSGRNLHTWTDFSFLDPEVEGYGADDTFERNNWGATRPPPRTWTLEVAFAN